jgi:hypothetical protein
MKKNVIQDNRYAGRDSNWILPRYKPESLPLEPTCMFVILTGYYYNDDTNEDTVVGEWSWWK